MTEEATEIKEIEPRARVLLIDVQPWQHQRIRIAQELFGSDAKSIEDFSQLAVTTIQSVKSTVEPSFRKREQKSLLYLPENPNDYAAVVVTGSPYAAYPREIEDGGLLLAHWKNDLLQFIHKVNENKIPYLGICFGEQALAEAMGGKVVRMKSKSGADVSEVTWGKIRKAPGAINDPLLKTLPDEFVAPEMHDDVVAKLPEGAMLLAENEYGVQGFKIGNSWGFEFHPERKPEKVLESFNDPGILRKMEEQGENPEQIKNMMLEYNSEIRTIYSNFLKFAWQGRQ